LSWSRAYGASLARAAMVARSSLVVSPLVLVGLPVGRAHPLGSSPTRLLHRDAAS
jgi:hypothetical protein